MKRKLILCVAILSGGVCANNNVLKRPPQSQAAAQETDDGDAAIHIHNHNNHKITVNNEEDPYDCTRLIGKKEFKIKMRWLSPAQFAENLAKMDPEAVRCYHESLTVSEAQELLTKKFDTLAKKDHLYTKLGGNGMRFLRELEKKIEDHAAKEEAERNAQPSVLKLTLLKFVVMALIL